MVKLVTQSDQTGMMQAAVIHSESWKASHKNICSAEFLAIHTPQRQKHYLETEMEKGAQLFMLMHEKPVGIVTIRGDLIENLYVLPSEQNAGEQAALSGFCPSVTLLADLLQRISEKYFCKFPYEVIVLFPVEFHF